MSNIIRLIATVTLAATVLGAVPAAAQPLQPQGRGFHGEFDRRGVAEFRGDRFEEPRRSRGRRGIDTVEYRGGAFIKRGPGWQEVDRRGRPSFFFVETFRDRGVIGLWDESRRVAITLDVNEGMIYYREGRRGRERPLYPIIAYR